MPYAVCNYGYFCIVLFLYCLNLQNVQTTSPCLNLPRHGCAILKYDKKDFTHDLGKRDKANILLYIVTL